MRHLKKYLLIGIGTASVGLGIAGIFIPLLPTTPFFLLAAACFARSSDSLYARLLNHRLTGHTIRCYREYRAVSRRTKVFTLLLLWATILYAVIFAANSWWLRAPLLAIAAGVSAHILHFRTLTREMIAAAHKAD